MFAYWVLDNSNKYEDFLTKTKPESAVFAGFTKTSPIRTGFGNGWSMAARESSTTEKTKQEVAMRERDLEFFKLDPVDRLVLIWLIENVDVASIKSWINYIKADYKRRKSIDIDAERLFHETQLWNSCKKKMLRV